MKRLLFYTVMPLLALLTACSDTPKKQTDMRNTPIEKNGGKRPLSTRSIRGAFRTAMEMEWVI